MPYPMIHMCIAKKVLDLNPNIIKNLPQYYLGNLAPDAVHFRENFKPDYKKTSHLYVGDERWGEVTNNEAWTENIITFLNNHKGSENIDFIYGYCIHVLGDMRNNNDFWIPLKQKLYNSLIIPSADIYDSEARKNLRIDEVDADNRLYKAMFQNEIRHFICESKAVVLEDVTIEEEIVRMRNNILFKQYIDISTDNDYVGKYVTYEAYLDFIDKTAKIISKLLFS